MKKVGMVSSTRSWPEVCQDLEFGCWTVIPEFLLGL